MNIRRTRFVFICAILCLAMVLSASCIFSPKDGDGGGSTTGPVVTPSAPDSVLQNLKVSFERQDIEIYRDCLHDNYYYLSPSAIDEPPLRWDRSEDVRIVGNIMEGSNRMVFTAVKNSVREEYGVNCPDIPEGATVVEEHPNEMWLVINYTVDMEIFTKSFGDINVHQYMDFSFVQDPDTKWYSIIQWNDLTNQ